ncbi:hypothetical protein Cgig2_025982 [Carnegiea gigantea]|uniref:Protein phosphatase n=1 Tax=Carnegiea gigantea TaxID=171969 RepID=A0A9Q1GTP5_9CARY|nr:hypothetical protein Cgig2_025982 [Carnegiea gigantea]
MVMAVNIARQGQELVAMEESSREGFEGVRLILIDEATDGGKYAQELMRNCEKLAQNSQGAGLTDIKEVLQQIAATTESSGSARVLIAHFAHQALHVANIGDTGFLIIRNGVIFKKSSPMVHEFNFPYAIGSGIDLLEAVEEYHFEVEDGDVIIAATDGLFDNIYEQEVASIVSKSVGAGMEPKQTTALGPTATKRSRHTRRWSCKGVIRSQEKLMVAG